MSPPSIITLNMKKKRKIDWNDPEAVKQYRAEVSARWRKKNKGYHKEWYHTKGKKLAKAKYQQNKEEHLKKVLENREKNKQKYLDYQRNYYKKNKNTNK